MNPKPRTLLFALALLTLASASWPNVELCKIFSDHMVLQRGKPVPVFGTAAVGESVTVSFAGQKVSTTASALGNWKVMLPAMPANTKGQQLTISGANTISISDVLVGDVWLCSGQSNMDMGLGGCNRKEDVDSANFPGIRSFRTQITAAGEPLKMLRGNPGWAVCEPASAGRFSAAAFYFARKIYQETKGTIPIGLLTSSVGGTSIDLWLAQEGLTDIPTLKPLLDQPVLPGGPFHLANGMIYPIAPYAIKGAIWYQGENAERTNQSPDSYFLKMKALAQGWKRLWGMDDFPFYFVMIANWGDFPKDSTPVLVSGGWNADTRLQQAMAMALPHAGCASAIDIGDSSTGDKVWDGWHPKDKLEVGERLALWALRNDYGRKDILPSGPVLEDAVVSGSNVICSFDYVGGGLMAATKAWYTPAKPTPNAPLKLFVIAGEDGKWFPAEAVIKGDKVIMSSPSVPKPAKISYACWQNPEGCNLFNKEGLPAAPFYVDDITRHFSIITEAGPGGEITPPGAGKFLKRMTALYTIKPKAGYFVQDVKVDGKSVGSVTSYTFGPIYENHTISATFDTNKPKYRITTLCNEGGRIMPSEAINVPQGASADFDIIPEPGLYVKELLIDGVKILPRDTFTFGDIRSNHSISATFGCKVSAEAGYGGVISPSGEVPANYNDNLNFKITTLPGFSVDSLTVDGQKIDPVSSYTIKNITTSHAVSIKFKSVSEPKEAKIPRTDQIVFAALAESLSTTEPMGPWPTLYPQGEKLTPISSPSLTKIGGKCYSHNLYLDGDGFNFKSFSEPIPCSGASIVCAARPIRSPGGSGWFSIVDVFYDRLTLGIRQDNGLVCVRRNGPIVDSKTAIPDGQITILSLIVQPDGTYRVYANGEEIMSNTEQSPMNELKNGVAGGFANNITVGRNFPDAWTTFNGDIGDVFLYKTALSDSERKELEAFIVGKLMAD